MSEEVYTAKKPLKLDLGANNEDPWTTDADMQTPPWWRFYVQNKEKGRGDGPGPADSSFEEAFVCKCAFSRSPSELDDDLCSISSSSESCSRKSSAERCTIKELEEDSIMEQKAFVGRRDSLLEAVMAAKRGGWRGLKRTDSAESGTSLSSSQVSDCTCDDCFLELSDKAPEKKKKSSNWRKVRNVVQWTPFIQTYKRHKYPWVQLAGHQGNFRAGYKQGTILKKLCPAEEKAFETLMKDTLKPFVPEYLGIVEGSDTDKYLQLQDLLSDFSAACVMDIKMGVRTYLEEELAKARIKPKLRKDMYDKMVQIDIKAPNEAEHRAKAVTKPRYMVWRETISSTATLGFRIEGVRRGDGTSSKDFKTTRTRDQVTKVILGFLKGYPTVMAKYIDRLKEIRGMLEKSKFFKSHELIGSSLLFVHNESRCGVWLIDFAKTIPLPPGVSINHSVPWIEGTHEDGYLIGIDNLIDLMRRIQADQQLYSTTNDLTKTASAPLNNVKRK